MESICVIINEGKNLDNFICGNNWKESRKLLSIRNPVNKKVIEKYFLDDDEIDTIKEAMSEKPQIFEFDYIFKSSNLINFYNCYISEKIKEEKISKFFTIYSNKFQDYFWKTENSKKNNFLLNFLGKEILQNNNQNITLKASIILGDTIEEIFDTQKKNMNVKNFETVLKKFNSSIFEYINEFEISNDIDYNLITFLTLNLENGQNYYFLILPEIEKKIDYKKSFLKKLINSLHRFLEVNIFQNKEDNLEFENSGKNKGFLSFENCDEFFLEFLQTNILDNFEFFFLTFLSGNEKNYDNNLDMLKHIDFLKNKISLLINKIDKDENFENEENAPKINDLNKYIKNIENKLEKAQSLRKNKKRNFSDKDFISTVNNQKNTKNCLNNEQNFENQCFSLKNNFSKNLSKSLKNNFENNLNKKNIQTSKNFENINKINSVHNFENYSKKNYIKKSNNFEHEFEYKKTNNFENDFQNEFQNFENEKINNFNINDQMGENLYKLMKEKVGRNEDIYEFRYKELERENIFLKNSFLRQNKNFLKLKNNLEEKNHIILDKKRNLEIEKKKYCIKEVKYKELKKENKFLKNLNEEIKIKLAKFEEKSKQKENQNNKLYKEKEKIILEKKLEGENYKRKILNLEEMKKNLEIDVKDLKNQIFNSNKNIEDHKIIIHKNSNEKNFEIFKKEKVDQILDIKNKEVSDLKKNEIFLKNKILENENNFKESEKKIKKKKKKI